MGGALGERGGRVLVAIGGRGGYWSGLGVDGDGWRWVDRIGIINTSGATYYADNTQYSYLLSLIFAAPQTGKSQADQAFCFPPYKQTIFFYLNG